MEDIENNNSQLGDLKKQLGTLIKDCEGLYGTYNEKRNKVRMILIRGDCSGTIWYKLLHLLSTRSYFLAGALEVFIKPIRVTSHSIYSYGEYVCVVSSWY